MDPDWSDALFASDLALDVRGEFHEAMEFGLSASEAARAVLSKYRDVLRDPAEGPVVIFCLAAMQMGAGQLTAVTREAALELIGDREALRAWSKGDGARRREIKAALDAFAEDLRAAPVITIREENDGGESADG